MDHNVEKKIAFINRYKKSNNAATGSEVDSNANVTSKNIATLSAELSKKDFIYLNRAIMKEFLLKTNGKKEGKKLNKLFNRDLAHHNIYSHDETSVMPYCVAVSLYPSY